MFQFIYQFILIQYCNHDLYELICPTLLSFIKGAQKEEVTMDNDLLFWARVTALHIYLYQRSRRFCPKMISVAYEDLLVSPKEALKDVLSLCKLPFSSFNKCLEVMSFDSQVKNMILIVARNSNMGMKILNYTKVI